MANKRFINRNVCTADLFTDLPHRAQLLYIRLNLEADDEGFIGNSKQVLAMVGAEKEDLDLLVDIGYLIPFDSKVYAIKHWWVHNRHDTRAMKPTLYTAEKSLIVEAEDGIYIPSDGTTTETRRVVDGRLYKTTQDDIIEDNSISNQTNIDKGIEEALIENSKGLVCLKDGESIIDYLSANEQTKIWNKYDHPLQLIDFVDDSIRERKEQKPIKNPYKYVVSVAEAQYWDTI